MSKLIAHKLLQTEITVMTAGIFTSLLVLIIPISSSLKIPKPVTYESPEISLSSYSSVDSFRAIYPDKRFQSQDQVKNEFITKNGSDYVISPEIKSITFICKADFPITWKFPFPEQWHDLYSIHVQARDHRISDFDLDISEPKNVRFESTISISCNDEDFFSANLTCGSVESNPQLESSVYIYLTGKTSIENEGETVHISLEPYTKVKDLPPLVLPCRPASPDFRIFLEWEKVETSRHGNVSSVQKTWKAVRSSWKSFTFDPKIGFTLQRDSSDSTNFGLFKCSVLEQNDDNTGAEVTTGQFVLINVTKEVNNDNNIHDNADEAEMEFEPKSITHGKASVQLVTGLTEKLKLPILAVVCCSGVKDKPPTLYSENCFSPLQCQRIKETILEDIANESEEERDVKIHENRHLVNHSDCTNEYLIAPSVIVVCKGENLDYAEEFVNLFNPLAGGEVTNRSDRIFEKGHGKNATVNTKHIVSLTQFKTSVDAKRISVEEKVILILGRPAPSGHIIMAQRAAKFGFGPGLYFRNAQNDLFQEDVITTDDLKIGLKRKLIVQLVEYERDDYYEGEPMIFMCFGLAMYYASGPHLRLNWENGTKSRIEKPSKNFGLNIFKKKQREYLLHLSGNSYMLEGDTNSLVSIFGANTIAKTGMTSVDCWMPLSNSSKWDKITKSLRVLPSVAPRFVEKLEEDVYFYLGDTGKLISCSLEDGKPFPDMKVTRDGMGQRLNFNEKPADTKKRLEHQNGTRDTETRDKYNHLFQVKIHYPEISYTHQGVLKCIASNSNGTVTRIVKVFVLGKSNKALSVCLTLAGVLCLALVGLGVKHWRDKRIVRSLQTNS